MTTEIDRITGGIDVVADTIIAGGNEYVVGEVSKWNMRNRYLQLKHTESTNVKKLLRIVNVKLTTSFNKKIHYDDTAEAFKSASTTAAKVQADAIAALQERANETPQQATSRLVAQYNLREPLELAMIDLVRILCKYKKMKVPSLIVNRIGKKYEQYFTRDENSKVTLSELIRKLLAAGKTALRKTLFSVASVPLSASK